MSDGEDVKVLKVNDECVIGKNEIKKSMKSIQKK